jgi:hypothetical protein
MLHKVDWYLFKDIAEKPIGHTFNICYLKPHVSRYLRTVTHPAAQLHVTHFFISKLLRAGRSGDRILMVAKFFAPVQTSRSAQQTLYNW